MYQYSTDPFPGQSPAQSIAIHGTAYEARPEVWPRWSLLNTATGQGELCENMVALNLRIHQLKNTRPPDEGPCDCCGEIRPTYPGDPGDFCWGCLVALRRINDAERPLALAAWSVTTRPAEKVRAFRATLPRVGTPPARRIASGPVLYAAPGGTITDSLPDKEIPDRDRVLRELIGSLREKLLYYGDTLKIGDEIDLGYGFRVRLDDDRQDRVRGGAVRTCPLIAFHGSAPKERRTLAQAYALPGGHRFQVNHLALAPAWRALESLRVFAGVTPVDPRTIAAELGIKLADCTDVPF